MSTIASVLALFAVAAAITAWFLYDQMKKKFSMLYLRLQKQLYETFFYSGARDFTRGPHQRNFVIRSLDGSQYTLTVYLKISSNMADPFISAVSDANGETVVSQYVGTGPATLFFEASPTTAIKVSSTNDDQKLTPCVSVKPHWFQRGFILTINACIAKHILRI
jgi:hypothetical protein